MVDYILKILTITLLCVVNPLQAQEIWREDFSTSEKGIWGCEEESICSDFSGINSWFLGYDDINLIDANDYAKTVSTSGGRFEVRDADGVIVWMSEVIDVSHWPEVRMELTAAETGSGPNVETKYLNTYYRLDGGEVRPFHTNAENRGNWGSVVSEANGITGDSLQIICHLSTHYASDKVILDDIRVMKAVGPVPPVKPFDVVINELMIDPNPPVGLPNAEYIELYNTRETAVDTRDWVLRINGVSKKVKKTILGAGDYLLLCATGSLEDLTSYGDVYNVVGFQGLLNKGATVELLDEAGVVLDRVRYTDGWYGDPTRSGGGWSLERIDPFRNCNPIANWMASEDPAGGTPGAINSVYGSNPDLVSPWLEWAVAVSDTTVELKFSEPMDSLQLFNIENFLIAGIGNPESIESISPVEVILWFSSPFRENSKYEIRLRNQTDACGNVLPASSVKIQWNLIGQSDLVINEILFDPFPGGEDFVEIFNCSEKLIDVSRLSIASRNIDGHLNQVYGLTDTRKIIHPGGFLVLTKDTLGVFPWFYIPSPERFLQMDRIPSYPNMEGVIVLLNEQREVIDEFSYSDKMHSPFFVDTEGVSLERVTASVLTNTPDNWQSASSLSGSGTPGYENSQAGDSIASRPTVLFEPQRFSPGMQKECSSYHIHYKGLAPGYVTKVKIFDSNGYFVHDLVKGELSGTRGSICWDGRDETGQLLSSGIYVVFVELYSASGRVYRFKDGVILSRD